MGIRTPLLVVFVCCTGCAQDKRPAPAAARPDGPESDAVIPALTDQEKASIREQVRANWIVDPGMAGLEAMTVRVAVEMNPDGSVQTVSIDRAADNANPNWREFAEMCRRAVLKSSPFHMPAGKPHVLWRRMTLIFSAEGLVTE